MSSSNDFMITKIEYTFPYKDAAKIQLIRKYGQLLEEEYLGDGIHVKAYVPMEIYGTVTPENQKMKNREE